MNVKKKKVGASAKQIFNGYLDKIVRPEVHLFGRTWKAFLLWQCIGIVVSTPVVLAIALFKDFSSLVMAGTLLISVLMSILLFKSVQVFGRPHPLLKWAKRSVYHYQILIVASATVFLWLIDQPILQYLDILVVGLAIAQINGRVGCLMAGCCHGRPHPWGVCYGKKHLEAGNVHYLQGVRLLPTQLLAPLWLFFLTVVAIAFILKGYMPGEILSWYVLGYGTGRFFLEFLRADHRYLYFWGFSGPQWTALTLMCAVTCMELAGILVFHLWHVGATVFLFSVAVIVSLKRRFGRSEIYEFLYPYHLRDFAGAVSWVFDLLTAGNATVKRNSIPSSTYEAVTSLNVLVSAASIDKQNGCAYQYSISYQNDIMTKEVAKTLAGLIIKLKHPFDPHEFIEGDRGVFQLLIYKNK